MGAVAAVDVPAEGERAPRPAPGTDWSACCGKLHETGRELEGFLQQVIFIVGKVALGLRVGVEHLGSSLSEGRAPTLALLDKSDVEQSLDAGKQGVEFLVRGGRAAFEALVEGAKVAATRALILVEHTREVVVRNIPSTQEKLGQVYSSFMRGYQSSGRSLGYPAYSAPPTYASQQAAFGSYAAPPASPGSFFNW